MAFGGGKKWKSREPRKERQPLDENGLHAYAVGVLSRRMRTVAELKRLMRLRVEPGETGEAKMLAVIARLKEYQFLNDTRYAAEYTRLRQENEKFGRRRVQQELMQRGVHNEIIGTTLDAAYEAIKEDELARKFLTRKRVKPPQDQKSTARVMRMLMRAGFSTGAIFRALKQWKIDIDEATLASLEVEEVLEDPEE